jgi:NAD/NADP transhydrogenase alpha subunit
MLTICILASFKAYSIVYTIPRDTLKTQITLDSVKKLVPRGFYVLTEQGARISIKTRIDADFYQAKWKITDEQLATRNGELLLMTLDRNRYRDQSARDNETIRLLKRKLFWAHFWKYTAIGAAVVLTTAASKL